MQLQQPLLLLACLVSFAILASASRNEMNFIFSGMIPARGGGGGGGDDDPPAPRPSPRPLEDFNVTRFGRVKAIYIDYKDIDWSAPQNTVRRAVDAGFNVVILAFYLSTQGAADMAVAWQGVSTADKQSTMEYAHQRNSVVMVSAGGATDDPYGMSGSAYGTAAATWAKNNFLDGVDFDLENFGPNLVARGLTAQQTVQWIVDATRAAKSVLGISGVVSHAPQAPYFGAVGSVTSWAGATGGYTGVEVAAGADVDFYLVQFYNQGDSCYTTYEGLFTKSCEAIFPGTSVMEINSYGVPLEKIVVGKPLTPSDASNGWVSAATLGQWFAQARTEHGWNAGVMGWLWGSTNGAAWLNAIFP